MRVRQYLLFIHRYGGLVIAVFLIIAALTGSIIAFEKELDAWLNPHLFKVVAKPKRLSPYQLRELVASRYPQVNVNSIDLEQPADASLSFYLRPFKPGQPALPYNKVFIDPYTGKELGKRNTIDPEYTLENLIPLVYRFHYSLLIPGKWGVWLMGGVALFWTLDCLIGFYLTLPSRKFSWALWKQAWKIKRGASFTRINFDIHRACGLWLWIVLLIIAVSSVRLSLYKEVFNPLVSLFSSISSPDIGSPKLAQWSESTIIEYVDAVRIAKHYLEQNNIPGNIQGVYYTAVLGQYQVSFKAKDTWQDIIGYSYIIVDAHTGLVTKIVWESGKTAGDTFIAWMFPLHSGKAFGLTGRIVIAISGVAITVLIITGLIIWWKKRSVNGSRLNSRRNLPSVNSSSSSEFTHSQSQTPPAVARPEP